MTLHIVERVLEVDDFHVERAVGTAERTITARALRYGVPYEVSDDGGRSFYHEVWRAGVFNKSLMQRGDKPLTEDAPFKGIPIHWHHQRSQLPYGAVVGVVDSPSDFVFRARIVNGDRGDEMLELIETRAVNGISVGARPMQNRSFNGGVERIEAALSEISLTTSAQISDGEILAVRAVMEQDEQVGQEQDDHEVIETPALDEVTAYLNSLERP